MITRAKNAGKKALTVQSSMPPAPAVEIKKKAVSGSRSKTTAGESGNGKTSTGKAQIKVDSKTRTGMPAADMAAKKAPETAKSTGRKRKEPGTATTPQLPGSEKISRNNIKRIPSGKKKGVNEPVRAESGPPVKSSTARKPEKSSAGTGSKKGFISRPTKTVRKKEDAPAAKQMVMELLAGPKAGPAKSAPRRSKPVCKLPKPSGDAATASPERFSASENPPGPVKETSDNVPAAGNSNKAGEKLAETGLQTEKNPEARKKNTDRWSDCGQIFFTSGKAFGISSNLRTVYIGTETDVRDFLLNGRESEKYTPIQLDALNVIKDYKAPVDLSPVEKNTPAAKVTGASRKPRPKARVKKRYSYLPAGRMPRRR